MSVVIYHAFPNLIPGGFFGVDVFFVISGYLIAGILLRDISAGTLNFKRFYLRRIRRLFPALAAVICATFVAGWFLLLPGEFSILAKTAASVNLFASNVFFSMQSGYFSPAISHNALLHTWSLAVEEQFYFIFPAMLFVLMRVAPRIVLPVLMSIAAASLAWAQYQSLVGSNSNFYLITSRAWEMLAGALLAVGLASGVLRSLSGQAARSAGALGLLGLVISFWALSSNDDHPGLITLIPVVSTLMILAPGEGRDPTAHLLSLPPLVHIGAISYSVYLWHQPVLAFAGLHVDGELPYGLGLGLVLGSLALGHLSWKFIETPFRSGRTAGFLTATRFAIASLILLVCSFAIIRSEGFSARLPASVQAVSAPGIAYQMRTMSCDELLDAPHPSIRTGLHNDEGSSRPIALWGDSHAQALTAGFLQALPDSPVLQATASGCSPVIGFVREKGDLDCDAAQRALLDLVQSPTSPDVVVVASRWAVGLSSSVDNGEGGVEGKKGIGLIPLGGFVDEADRKHQVLDAYIRSVEDLIHAGKTVVLVYPTPEIGWNVPTRAGRLEWFNGPDRDPVSVSSRFYDKRTRLVIEGFDRMPENPRLVRVPVRHLFCDAELEGRCVAERNGRPLYRDDDHLSDQGALMVADEVLRVMTEAGISVDDAR
jgi:peptidoglycan/LPS O-acetylase OafA/YrhL